MTPEDSFGSDVRPFSDIDLESCERDTILPCIPVDVLSWVKAGELCTVAVSLGAISWLCLGVRPGDTKPDWIEGLKAEVPFISIEYNPYLFVICL